jgi:hypothetical protein
VRFFGVVGYGESVETAPGSGKWEDQFTEREYYGDILRNTRQLVDGTSVNENIVVGNRISILADHVAYEYFADIKYVEWAGKRWMVTDVVVDRPRLILSIGSVFNG